MANIRPNSSPASRSSRAPSASALLLFHVHSSDEIACLDPLRHIRARHDAAEYGVLAVQIGPVGERHINLAVGERRVDGVSHRDGAFDVMTLARNLRDAVQRTARTGGT